MQTMPNTALLDRILKAPNLPTLVEQAQAHLRQEQAKRQEFYDLINEDSSAEFINGQIVMHSPVRLGHNRARRWLTSLVEKFIRQHQLGAVEDEKVMVHLTRNSFEPDIAFWRKAIADNFDSKQLLFPAPDWVVEIVSPSTEKIDRTIKYNDYALHGVSEYWIIDPDKQTVEQYLLDTIKETYTLHRKVGIEDEIESQIIQGFRIPIKAIFEEEENQKTLQRI